MSREYKWYNVHLLKTMVDATLIMSCVAGISWVGEKVLKVSLVEDPSKSVIGFIKMSASVCASDMFLNYIDKSNI